VKQLQVSDHHREIESFKIVYRPVNENYRFGEGDFPEGHSDEVNVREREYLNMCVADFLKKLISRLTSRIGCWCICTSFYMK
jgi:hypothetical protein